MTTNTNRGYTDNAIAQLPNSALLLLWAGMTFGFAVAYWIISLISPDHGPTIAITVPPFERFFDSLYFSIMTATSVGFGDIVPQGFSKILTSIQAIASLSTFAILVTKLVSQKQEHFTENLYRLSNEESAHTILDEFHLVRQDIDILLTHLTHAHQLSDPEWHDFDVAIARVQAAFLDIPKLYDEEGLVTLSERRENLLVEGAVRTFIRIQQFFHALRAHTVNLPPNSIRNVDAFLTQSKKLVDLWENSISKNNQSSLEDLRQVVHHIEEHLRKG
ncbi:two pore domain potassium channel family protein [Candidatus Peregrinibacteria bacterium]|nr:two pore domain potassium channel family protein [Candidatus Peregrinibacteria bacterium]